MASEVALPKRKLPVLKLAIAAVVLLVLAGLALRGVNLVALKDRSMELIRDAGPAVFFTAMTILPAFGMPMLAFTIPAGEAFRSQMGLGGVIAISLVVVAVNLALAYWVARYALRPLLTGLLKRYGYSVPRVTAENALSVALIVRVMPSTYTVQAYILGLAEVPFRLYMIVSWLWLVPWVLGGIVLGQGALSGDVGVAGVGFGVLVAAAVAVHWARKKYLRRAN